MKSLIINRKLLVVFLIYVLLYPLPFTLYPVYADEPKISSEEQSVYNLNSALLPNELAQVEKPPEQNILQRLLTSLANIFSSLFKVGPADRTKLYSQSENIHQANLPQELGPKNDSLVEKVKGFLGTSTGFYGVDLPETADKPAGNPVEQYEKLYEQANFPDEVRPITGQ